MDTLESLNHSVWDCKYHVVFIPKCRRKDAVWRVAAVPGGGIPKTGAAEGESD